MKSYMLIVALLVGILLGSTVSYAYFLSVRQPRSYLVNTLGKVNAYKHLVSSYNSTLGLCFEFPESNVYWVSHDNVLASYALQNWNRTVADNITETMQRIIRDYGLTASSSGIPVDTRAEILLGYSTDLFFNQTEGITLNSSYYGSVLKTERANSNVLPDFENYTDLLCYATLVEWRKENYSGADHYYEEARTMWDGNGFRDQVFNKTGYYATYKLGLFYLTSNTLGKNFDFKKELVDRVGQCQLLNGGFITDYFGNGSFPVNSKTNTETTSIMLLADFPAILEITDYDNLARNLSFSTSLNYIFMTTIIILAIAVVYAHLGKQTR
jgi:hypothetical protein